MQRATRRKWPIRTVCRQELAFAVEKGLPFHYAGLNAPRGEAGRGELMAIGARQGADVIMTTNSRIPGKNATLIGTGGGGECRRQARLVQVQMRAS
jgi:hypothetical protein